MKKCFIFLLLITTIILGGCSSTFTKSEFKKITDINNYQKYQVKVLEFKTKTPNVDYNQSDICLTVAFLTLEDLNSFKTTPLQQVNNLDDYPMEYVIFQENSKKLYENNFYTEISNGDIISLWICRYKDNASTYPYIAGVETESKVYLSTSDGLKGIGAYMDEHKSPFFQ